MNLHVLRGSGDKERLSHYTKLTDRFYNREQVRSLRGTDLTFIYIVAVFSSLNGHISV